MTRSAVSVRRLAVCVGVLALTGALAVPADAVPLEAAQAGQAPTTALPTAALPTAAAPATVPKGRLRGRVLSTTTGEPVPGVSVRLTGPVRRMVRTGPDGRYLIRTAAGRYAVRLNGLHYLEAQRVVRVRKGRIRTRDFRLAPLPEIRLSGMVRDASGQGWPLAAVVTVISSLDGVPVRRETTTSDPVTGHWAVTTPGEAGVLVTATTGPGSGYEPTVAELQLSGSGDTSATFDLRMVLDPQVCGFALGYESQNPNGYAAPCRPQPGGLVTGRVTSGLTGAGLANAQVTGLGAPVDPVPSFHPGLPEGLYTAFAPAGPRTATVRRPQYAAATRSVVVTEGGVTRLDVPLAAGRLSAVPASVEVTGGGGPVARTIRLSNTGTAPVRIEVAESGEDTGAVAPVTTWESLPPLPEAVRSNGAAVLDGVLYSVGGRTGPGPEPTASVYAYIDAVGWSPVADLPVALSNPTIGAVDHRLVVTLGYDEEFEPQGVNLVYDPVVDRWSNGAGIAGEKADSGSAVLGDKVYVVAGCGESGCDGTADSSVQVYNVADDSVTEVASYPGAEDHPLCGGIDGRVYCTGGRSYEGDDPTGGSFAYDPATDRWTPFADPPVTLADGAVSPSGGRLVVTGGIQDGSVSGRTWAYEPGRGTWQELAASGQAVSDAAGACGHYRLGGTLPDGTPVATAQRRAGLTGLTDCGAPDVTWLSLSTTRVDLGPGDSQEVTVTLDPAGLPAGTYEAAVRVIDDVPGGVRPIPVRFTVR